MTASEDIPILEGAEFKELWEERLTPEAKRIVRRAVRQGKALEDKGLASVAVSLARRYQRLPRVAIAIALLLTLFWVWVFVSLLSMPPTRNVVFWRFLAGAWILLVPLRLALFLFFWRPRYREAERANRMRVENIV